MSNARSASQETAAPSATRGLGLAALMYAVFVVYGSLVPLDFHYLPPAEAWTAFLQVPYLRLGVASRADWVANILLYIPLSFFATGWFGGAGRVRAFAASIVAFTLCMLLAVGVEFIQLYFPPRTVSLNDIVAETIGTGLGVAIWLSAGKRVLHLWREVQRGGPAGGRALFALYTLAYLALALFPYDFLVSTAELSDKLVNVERSAFLVTQLCGGTFECSAKLMAEVVTVAPLGVFLGLVTASTGKYSLRRAFIWGMLLGLLIEGLQGLLASGISQGISIFTRGVGMALGLATYRFFRKEWLSRYRAQAKAGVLLVLPVYLLLLLALNGFFATQWESVSIAVAKLQEVRILPFYYHYFTTETQAMYSLLVHAGLYAPIGVAIWILRSWHSDRAGAWVSALLAAATAFVMETLKLFLNGKKPDPTDVLIGAAAAAIAYVVTARVTRWTASESFTPEAVPRETALHARPPARRVGPRVIVLASGIVIGLVALLGWVIAVQPREHLVDESKLPQFPAPSELPPVNLPRFKLLHPRLPSPSEVDLTKLDVQNPALLVQLRRRADGGKGDMEAAALQELVKPGSIDLNLFHRRLLEVKFAERGHEQVKPLALAYDWLYQRWSPSQRAELASKLADGCDYLIDVIRRERLSPYNVILYNAPLQALMACGIAIYGEEPRGEASMRFTYDLWKNRVLPTWRQVMGHNGGWHEGGEYVGIGIGQAIYELPAMWRKATGEDLFAAEPGIRGFLDFLVYRTRPDGTQARWGDGAFFNKIGHDTIPLALEFRHAAAYSLRPPAKEIEPSGWPWGPLTDSALVDPLAAMRLPLTRYFDGIGLVVARSDWTADSTYVTFKAGDNYWSHTHLDQGAFTIYKGGELAIDSGLYGPSYGSDHHMNYAYQTVAHNTITVTDPDDTVPAPGKQKPRPIANDGGQRRVGSGWGVEAAPLDRAEWEIKRKIYHTATMERVFESDGLTVAIADITPAYTNEWSGQGSFSHRTRRVERFWRVFGYDHADEAIIVFDQVIATKDSFRKRWLLHTIEEPRIEAQGFSVSVSPQNRPGHAGGRLEGKVLLPKDAQIFTIGGRGFEFFVDNKNYDDDGALRDAMKKLGPNNGEPGAWRIEVSPPRDEPADNFLVVLLPSAAQRRPTHQVRLLEAGNRVGCEIVGTQRTTRWWFEPGRNGVNIEVSAGSAWHRYQVEGQTPSAPPKTLWLARVRSWFDFQ